MQCLLRLHQDARSAPGDHRDVAAELDGVAQALLAVQQDSLSFDWFAKPERLVESVRVRTQRLGLPSRLVARPSGFEVAGEKLHHAGIQVRLRVIWLDSPEAIVLCQCLVEEPEVSQHEAPVAVQIREVLPQRQRVVVGCQRFLEPAQRVQHHAAVVKRLDMVRLHASARSMLASASSKRLRLCRTLPRLLWASA